MEQTEQKTYTLNELVGQYPKWWHYYYEGERVAYCGNRNINWANTAPRGNGRICPDCVRIHEGKR